MRIAIKRRSMLPGESTLDSPALLRLLQLASPALPVGAYSYSEGVEYAVEHGVLRDRTALHDWLEDALAVGSARLEAAILARAYAAAQHGDTAAVHYWNAWLTAARESEELRLQNLEMGGALLRLLAQLPPPLPALKELQARPCNYAVAFALAAAHWRIPRSVAVTVYLQTWAANLIGAGVKLIPLGQTAGQQLLWDLQPSIEEAAQAALQLVDAELAASNWGAALASMRHETQYSRLFRS